MVRSANYKLVDIHDYGHNGYHKNITKTSRKGTGIRGSSVPFNV